jgi:hypothetical protein
MAFRTWAQTLGTAAGAAFLAAAGQLGVGSGLGLLRWDGDFTDSAAWHTQLGWLAFLTALATVAGAAVGRWAPAGFAGTSAEVREQRWVRAALCAAAAVGAAVFIPIGTRPARGVHIPVAGSAGSAAGVAMLLGLVLGVAVGYAVLSVPAVGGNVVTCAIWLWLAALFSALWSLRERGDLAGAPVTRSAARLGLIPPAGAVTAVVLLLVVPAAIGLVAALVSRFGGGGRWAVAGSGAAGPLLVAGAYVIAGPGGGSHTVAYWCSIGGVATGVAASAFVALARRTGAATPDGPGYAATRWDDPESQAGARHAAADAPDFDGGDLPVDSASTSSWPDASTSASRWPDDTSSTASGWPESSSTSSSWPESSAATSSWPESSSGTSNWPESSSSGAASWPESSSTASSWSGAAGVASSEPDSASASAGSSAAGSSSSGWSSSEAARRWLEGGSASLSTDSSSPASVDAALKAPTDPALSRPTGTYQVADEVEQAATDASDRAVAAFWGDAPAQPVDTGYAGGHEHRDSAVLASTTTGSRHRPTYFESAPAPEVPMAPSSRGGRAGSLFDADPVDEEPFESRGRHSGGAVEAPDPDAVAPTSPAAGGAPEAADEAPEEAAEPVPTGRLGRRARKAKEAAAKEAAQPPAMREGDSEYVDWFKDLRGSGRS